MHSHSPLPVSFAPRAKALAARWGSLLLVITLFLAGCATSASDNCAEVTAENAESCLRLNQLQVLGTHNSYHIQPHDDLVETLDAHEPGWAADLAYTHRPLIEQLEELGIRQFELDVYADPEGGRYARPAGHRLADPGGALDEPAMQEPGYKVFHILDVDYRSTCPTLVQCLQEVRAWSLANPDHVPILILVEVKDGAPSDTEALAFTKPVPVTGGELDALDAEIRSVFDADHLLTPDDVRGNHDTLEDAILEDGWPTLAASRGKILIALDNTDRIRDAYLEDHPTLEGRAMFASSPPGTPSAGFIKMNDPLGENMALIQERVAAGYIIRTRADVPTRQGRSGDTTRREAALSSGAQFVSTDYPEPSPFGSGYVVRLPGAADQPARCNPVSGPPECTPAWIAR